MIKGGDTIDFYLSEKQNTTAAETFLKKTLANLPKQEKPQIIHTDMHAAHKRAIVRLWIKGQFPNGIKHKRIKYLNNRIESDHAKLKRIIKPTLGFKTFQTAAATLAGFELMRMFKKGQFAAAKNVKQEADFLRRVLVA